MDFKQIIVLTALYFAGCILGLFNIFLETRFLKRIVDESYTVKKPVYRTVLFGIALVAACVLMQDYAKGFYIFTLFFICYLIVRIDLKVLIIPNKLILALLIVSILAVGLKVQPTKPLDALIGLIVGFIIAAIPYFTGGKIGGGDVKLIAAIGLCVGYIRVAYVAIMVGILNILYIIFQMLFRKKHFLLSLKDMLPMGPFIAASFMIYVFAQNLNLL